VRLPPHATLIRSLALSCLAALALPGAPAKAEFIVVGTSTPIPTSLTEVNAPLTFARFDPSLGMLLSVRIMYSTNLDTQLTVTNGAATPSSGNARTEVTTTLQTPGANIPGGLQTDRIFPSPAYAYSLPSGGSVTSPLFTASASADETYNTAAILAEFTGPGSIALTFSTLTQTLLANTGGVTSTSQVTHASATGTVIYEYLPIPVPEPSSWALMGIGGAAVFGAWARRRQIQRQPA
jgi:hypothetical protein